MRLPVTSGWPTLGFREEYSHWPGSNRHRERSRRRDCCVSPGCPFLCKVEVVTKSRCVRGDQRNARWSGAEGAMCARHFVTSRPIQKRAIATALVVGSILVAINQGDALISGSLDAALAWKVPMTYAVPYLVTTWGALGGGAAPRST